MVETVKEETGMNPVIKERIEKIRKGIVPEGYKKTELSIVPKSWKLKYFKEIFTVSQGLQIPISKRLKTDGLNRYVYITNEYINNLQKAGVKQTEYILNPSKSVVCKENDILMTRTGNTGVVVTGVKGVFHNNFFKIAFDETKFNKDFIVYLLKSNYIQHEIKRLAGTSTIPDLNHSDFYGLKVHFPRLDEQQKIADILSTWDRAIELKESLVKEKEEQKKGLYNNIFSETNMKNWEKYKLGEIGQFRTSSVNKKIKKKEEPVKLLNYMDVYNNKIIKNDIDFMKTTATQIQKRTNNAKVGDVFFTPSSETRNDIGHSAVVLEDIRNLVYSYHLIRFRVNHDIDFDINFRAYCFNNKFVLNQMSRLCTGSTRYTLSILDFESIEFFLPSISEQKKIASILSTLDKQITLLKQELELLKEQKRGLMQLLLTGIVRVGEVEGLE